MNRKQKKLKFIREKNFYRLGGLGRFPTKIATEMINEVEYIESFVNSRFNEYLLELKYRFGFSFEVHDFSLGMDVNDFIKNTTTVMVTFKRLY